MNVINKIPSYLITVTASVAFFNCLDRFFCNKNV